MSSRDSSCTFSIRRVPFGLGVQKAKRPQAERNSPDRTRNTNRASVSKIGSSRDNSSGTGLGLENRPRPRSRQPKRHRPRSRKSASTPVPTTQAAPASVSKIGLDPGPDNPSDNRQRSRKSASTPVPTTQATAASVSKIGLDPGPDNPSDRGSGKSGRARGLHAEHSLRHARPAAAPPPKASIARARRAERRSVHGATTKIPKRARATFASQLERPSPTTKLKRSGAGDRPTNEQARGSSSSQLERPKKKLSRYLLVVGLVAGCVYRDAS